MVMLNPHLQDRQMQSCKLTSNKKPGAILLKEGIDAIRKGFIQGISYSNECLTPMTGSRNRFKVFQTIKVCLLTT
jgi:hypothetical protein